MDDIILGILAGVFLIITVLLIISAGIGIREKSIKEDCETFGKFKIEEVVYTCEKIT